MRRPLPLPRLVAQPARAASPGGLWVIVGDLMTRREAWEAGPAIVLVPTEQVLLLTADLPLAGTRRRAEALPFAIEDRIAQPLADVHVALGEEVASQRHLAGVVSHEAMARWMALIAEAGIGDARLVPDVLALARPPLGGWNEHVEDGRALVRREDGTGLVLPADRVEAVWRAAGEPARVGDAIGGSGWPATPALDLRQGRYARARARTPLIWRRAATIAAAGLIAHGAIATADTLALRNIAARRAEVAREAIARVAPGVPLDGDLASTAADLLPANGAGSSHFLPMLSRVAGALRPLGPGASFRSVAFDASANTMSIEVEAPDIAGLQRVGGALGAAGLAAESGAASQSEGKAIGAFLVRGGA